jgi:hypothetical protein
MSVQRRELCRSNSAIAEQTLKRTNPKEGPQVSSSKQRASGRVVHGVLHPEGGAGVSLDTLANVMGVAAFERAYGTVGGTNPRRGNPKSGSGMKQVHDISGGAKR